LLLIWFCSVGLHCLIKLQEKTIKSWKIYWFEQSFTGLGPEDRCCTTSPHNEHRSSGTIQCTTSPHNEHRSSSTIQYTTSPHNEHRSSGTIQCTTSPRQLDLSTRIFNNINWQQYNQESVFYRTVLLLKLLHNNCFFFYIC
jgi:hypothetical protein